MPRTIPIQTSFAGGELSPKLRGRVDTEIWRKGLAYCENFEPLAHGPVLSRGGTRYAASFDSLTSQCRLIEFPRQGDVGFLLVLGNGTMAVRNGTTGAQVEAGAIDWILNPRFKYGKNYWTWELASVVQARYLLFPRNQAGTMVGGVWQTRTAVPAGDYVVSLRYSTAAGNALRVRVGSGGPLTGDILTATAPGTANLSSYTTYTSTFTLAAPTDVSLYVESDNTNYELIQEAGWGVEVVELAIRAAGTGDAIWDSGTTPAMPWTDDQLEALQFVAEPANNRMIFVHPEVAPYELIYDGDTEAWSFQAITFTFTNPGTPDWGASVFPATAEIYQGRLFLAGVPGKRNTLFASKSGEAYDFTRGNNANDAFSLDISTKGSIRWMQGHRTLLLGTDRGEFIVTAQAGVLTPSDFEVRPQSGFGAAATSSAQIGDQAMYVSRDRRRIRLLSFNLQENGWQTRDLTFTSEHLTGGLIKEVSWLSTGNDQIIAVMRSGEVVCWTYNRAEGVAAPWRATFGDSVYSLAVLDSGDQDKVWMLVQREGTVALEEWIVADDPERVLLDSWSVVAGVVTIIPPYVTVYAGYQRLAGREVYLLNDGTVYGPYTVTESGAIRIDGQVFTHNFGAIGLWNPRTLTTLPKEGGNPGGTAQGAKQRMVKASLRLNDSAIPLVNGVRAAPERVPGDPMDEQAARRTGDVTARVLGWEDKGAITVSQDVPLRTEVLALFGVVSTNEV